MSNPLLETRHDGRLLQVTMNRPEKRNALSVELCQALASTLDRANDDHTVGAVLLTARGKTFCAGMDLSEMGVADPAELNQTHEALFTVGLRMTKPLVAVVEGAALGGGTGLVANAHVVVASVDATFGLTEIRLGLWPFLIFRTVALAIGERRAVELSLTGRLFSAEEGAAMGLVHHVSEAPMDRALGIAQSLSESSAFAMRSGLEFVREIRGRDWEESGEIGRRVREQVLASPDFREGVTAFQAKRAPQWPSIS